MKNQIKILKQPPVALTEQQKQAAIAAIQEGKNFILIVEHKKKEFTDSMIEVWTKVPDESKELSILCDHFVDGMNEIMIKASNRDL